MATLSKEPYRETLGLIASLTVLLGLLALLVFFAYTNYGNAYLALEFDSQHYQGVTNCVLVADLYTGGLTRFSTNRLQINYTEDCVFCARPWVVEGSKTFRVRFFVRPCPPGGPI